MESVVKKSLKFLIGDIHGRMGRIEAARHIQARSYLELSGLGLVGLSIYRLAPAHLINKPTQVGPEYLSIIERTIIYFGKFISNYK